MGATDGCRVEAVIGYEEKYGALEGAMVGRSEGGRVRGNDGSAEGATLGRVDCAADGN